MKKASTVILLGLAGFAGELRAQEPAFDAGSLLDLGRVWVEENIDTELIGEWASATETRMMGFWNQVQPMMQEDSVTELADKQGEAQDLLKLLEASENTAPYASWLRTRMDYFQVAEDLRRLSRPAAPPPAANPPENPTPRQPPPRQPTARQPAPKQPAARQPAPRQPAARRPIPPTAKKPPARRPPPPQVQRKVWEQRIAKTPVPRGAAALVPRLKPVFAKFGMPEQFVWLAEVESSFDPSARSPVGAAGLYQFMPATAKHLGLSLAPKDERLVPEKSAQAAAQYLSYLHRRFGDWPLALAAYNAGEGRVSKLLKSQNSKTFNAIASRLPAETQLYVPKFEGVLLNRESVRLEDLPAPKKLK